MVSAYNLMKNIIKSKKMTADYCYSKINTFFAVGALTEEQYTELAALIKELYGE